MQQAWRPGHLRPLGGERRRRRLRRRRPGVNAARRQAGRAARPGRCEGTPVADMNQPYPSGCARDPPGPAGGSRCRPAAGLAPFSGLAACVELCRWAGSCLRGRAAHPVAKHAPAHAGCGGVRVAVRRSPLPCGAEAGKVPARGGAARRCAVAVCAPSGSAAAGLDKRPAGSPSVVVHPQVPGCRCGDRDARGWFGAGACIMAG